MKKWADIILRAIGCYAAALAWEYAIAGKPWQSLAGWLIAVPISLILAWVWWRAHQWWKARRV